jgi:hypothetical protein
MTTLLWPRSLCTHCTPGAAGHRSAAHSHHHPCACHPDPLRELNVKAKSLFASSLLLSFPISPSSFHRARLLSPLNAADLSRVAVPQDTRTTPRVPPKLPRAGLILEPYRADHEESHQPAPATAGPTHHRRFPLAEPRHRGQPSPGEASPSNPKNRLPTSLWPS